MRRQSPVPIFITALAFAIPQAVAQTGGASRAIETPAPVEAQVDQALVAAFLAAANDRLARKIFLSERFTSAGADRDEAERVLIAGDTAGGLMLVSATRRGQSTRLMVSTPSGRSARVELIAAAEPGRLAAIQTVPIPAQYAAGGDLLTDLPAAIDRRVRFAADRDDFSGTVLVMKDEEVIYSASFGYADRGGRLRNGPETRFNLGSMDKQFTAIAIGQLVEQGRLGLDTRVIDVLPDYPNRSAATQITIRHLLSHRAGLGMLFERPGWSWKRRYKRVGELLPIFAAEAPAFAPGSRYGYSNEGFVVLGAVIERVTGKNWYDYVQQNIFKRSGMLATEYLTDDPANPSRATGYKFAASDPLGTGARVANWDTLSWRGNSCGGGYSTAGDMLRFLRALRSGKLLRSDTLAEITGPVEGQSGYAMGFQRIAALPGRTIVGHDGGGPSSGINSDAKMVLETGYAYAVLGNYDAPFAQTLGRDIGQMIVSK